MSKRDSLVRMAAIGERSFAALVNDEAFAGKFGIYPPAAQILLWAARFSYESKAGSIAGARQESLLQVSSDTSQKYLSKDAMDYFFAMIHGDAEAQLLYEWCRLVYQSEQVIGDEYLPFFLDMGKRLDSFRTWFRAVMSPRAEVLASHNEHWRWAGYTPLPHPKKLSGINVDSERHLLSLFHNMVLPYDISQMLLRLSCHMFAWSKDLSKAFLKLLDERYLAVLSPDVYTEAVEYFAIYAPLDDCLGFLDYIAKFPTWDKASIELSNIIHFRQGMHKAILQAAD